MRSESRIWEIRPFGSMRGGSEFGHWPLRLSIQPFPPTLLTISIFGRVVLSSGVSRPGLPGLNIFHADSLRRRYGQIFLAKSTFY